MQQTSHLNKKLLERIFTSASIRRWNDKAVPLDFVELDKQAHKVILAYIFAKYEENEGRSINYTKLIRQFLFEFFERIVLTDIKPPVFHKLKSAHGKELAAFVAQSLANELQGFDFFHSMQSYLAEKNDDLETKILQAAHFYASKWEFDIIYHFNPKLYDIENIKAIIDSQTEGFYDLVGMKNLYLYQDIKELVGMFAELRFQKRWSQTPRIPQTSVLGHMLMVAICAYLLSVNLNVCEKMQINHFFGGLFHDLPEVLTRDIISPIKRSVKGLDSFIKGIEKEEMETKILSKLPHFIRNDLIYWTEDEFANRYKEHDKVVFASDINQLLTQFNHDKYMPVCGELLKFCDKLTAFLEARISIAHGVSSPDLVNGAKALYGDLLQKEILGVNIGLIVQDFM
ncbi:HD domain-containing protein [Helicobacter bilis]|uniref:HD domain-containing protein n=1 Tax=Helicobacter bilis TaxID=37372 RepID=A0A4U8U9D7_9HELI|nr:HD domain-containing protein [Helicobacter bilis]TLE09174.1 HD domain-containing protein [Helicobacter bilis]TLE11115.1 HD domain-containing protein [Helicobacter bilis]